MVREAASLFRQSNDVFDTEGITLSSLVYDWIDPSASRRPPACTALRQLSGPFLPMSDPRRRRITKKQKVDPMPYLCTEPEKKDDVSLSSCGKQKRLAWHISVPESNLETVAANFIANLQGDVGKADGPITVTLKGAVCFFNSGFRV